MDGVVDERREKIEGRKCRSVSRLTVHLEEVPA